MGKKTSTPAPIRFWRLVDKKDDPNACWLWTASCKAPGSYGTFGYKVDGRPKTVSAHRFAYADTYGPIPTGMHVLHKCDVRNCVNPNHLFLGTPLDNSRDMFKKGRHPLSRPGGFVARGEQLSDITEDQIRAIRVFYATGRISYKAIGDVFGITAAAIHHICDRKNWRHVE